MLLVFGITLAIYHLEDRLAVKLYGPNTKTQITESFDNALKSNASNWILGNSRVYRGLNPDVMGKSWYNFAHDNDSYNQMYYKLKYLLDNNCKIDTLIIGTDYFQFSIFANTRNYVYDNLLGSDYISDYNKFCLKEYIDNLKRVIVTKQGLLYDISLNINKLNQNRELPYIRNNGQYINDTGTAKEDDFVDRDTTMLDIQKQYYEKILSACSKNKIKVVVLMMPIRDNEMKCYSTSFTERFDDYIHSTLKTNGYEGRNYINLSGLNEFKDYHLYTDITHLNSKAADGFTISFMKRLSDRI